MIKRLLSSASRRLARVYRSKPFVMRNSSPIVSFTFDDVPESAYTNGASVLESRGVHGTFYIASGQCGWENTTMGWRNISLDQVRALHDRGHEIGCHTFTHPRVDQVTSDSLREECRKNREVLHDLCADIKLDNFCYPFGRVSLPSKRQLEACFDSCRGTYKGINAGTVDLGLLRVIQLYDNNLSPDELRRVVKENRDRNGWLIFYTHDVAESASPIGCSPQLLRAAVEAAQEAEMPCFSIREALTAIGYKREAKIGKAA